MAATAIGVSRASAAQDGVDLGTASSFAVLGGSTVTNTGPSVISGDLGVSPGTAVTGFPPGIVNNGTIHAADAVAAQAQADLTTAYNDAAGRAPSARVGADLAGQTLVSGVYTGPTLGLTGTVTLDAQGDPAAVFIFQAASTLITSTSSTVSLVNGATACNVFWQVGSSATLGTNSVFVGTVMALTSVTANTGTTVQGRLLARNGAVTLDSTRVTRPTCAAPPASTTTTVPPTTVPPTTVPPTTVPPTTVPPTTVPPTTVPPTTVPPTTVPPTTVPVATTITVPATAITEPPPVAITPPPTSATVPATTGSLAVNGGAAVPTLTRGGATTTTSPSSSSRRITTRLAAGSASDTSGSDETATGTSRTTALSSTSLARTGSHLVGVALVGLITVLLGAVALFVSQRRTAGTHLR